MALFSKKDSRDKEAKEPKEPQTFRDARAKLTETQETEVDKAYKRKLFVVRYGRVIVYGFIGVIGIVFLVWQFMTGFAFIRGLLPEREPEVVDTTEKPPEDFSIDVSDLTVIPGSNEEEYDVFARLTNTDVEWGAASLQYTVTLLDANGNPIGEKKGATYVLPNSQRTLIEIGVVASGIPTSADLSLEPQMVQKLRDFGTIDFEIKDSRLITGTNRSRVQGVLVNNSPFGFEQVDINVVLFDTSNQIVGLNKTNVNALLSSQERDFAVTWNEKFDDSTQVVIEPNVNVFDSSTFLNTFSNGEAVDFDR